MKFTIRKYEKDGWQIWDTDYSPTVLDVIGESDYFLVALVQFLYRKAFNIR